MGSIITFILTTLLTIFCVVMFIGGTIFFMQVAVESIYEMDQKRLEHKIKKRYMEQEGK